MISGEASRDMRTHPRPHFVESGPRLLWTRMERCPDPGGVGHQRRYGGLCAQTLQFEGQKVIVPASVQRMRQRRPDGRNLGNLFDYLGLQAAIRPLCILDVTLACPQTARIELRRDHQSYEVRNLYQHFEMHHTSMHVNWLNMTKAELSALDQQCLSQQLASLEITEDLVAAWATQRNQQQTTIQWHFTAEHASIKLKHLHSSFPD